MAGHLHLQTRLLTKREEEVGLPLVKEMTEADSRKKKRPAADSSSDYRPLLTWRPSPIHLKLFRGIERRLYLRTPRITTSRTDPKTLSIQVRARPESGGVSSDTKGAIEKKKKSGWCRR